MPTTKELIQAKQEVESALHPHRRIPKEDDYFDLQKYIGTRLEVWGVKMPVARKLSKQGYSFSHLESDEQYLFWKYIWLSSENFDVMTQALFFCDRYIKYAEPDFFFQEMQEWLQRVDNWAHSDQMTHYFAALHERMPSAVYPVLKQWNNSANAWERRQSVLSLLDYARFRKKYPPFTKITALVKTLLADKDVFVQKGIGWCLRETGHIYPKETYAFLEKYHAHLSSIAFSSASEKLTAAKKEKLKTMRKRARTL